MLKGAHLSGCETLANGSLSSPQTSVTNRTFFIVHGPFQGEQIVFFATKIIYFLFTAIRFLLFFLRKLSFDFAYFLSFMVNAFLGTT